MKLIKFIYAESNQFGLGIFLLGILSGVLNTVLLFILNGVITVVGNVPVKMVVYYFVVLLLSTIFQRFFQKRMITLSQSIMFNARNNLVNDIRKTDLQLLEKIGHSRIYKTITYDIIAVGGASRSLVGISTSAVSILCCLIYLAFTSLVCTALVLGAVFSGVFIYLTNDRAITAEMRKANKIHERIVAVLGDLLMGFKEIKLNREKDEVLFKQYYTPLSVESEALSAKSMFRYMNNATIGKTVMLLIVGFCVFFLPQLSILTSNDAVKVLVMILYLLGPVTSIVSMLPGYKSASISVDRIEELRANLRGNIQPVNENPISMNPVFDRIEMQGVSFDYKDGYNNFNFGKVDFQIRQGEIVFVVGGNGSGKSTFVKLLTGLYRPDCGSLKLNGSIITPESLPSYQSLYSCIFSDYHPFTTIYSYASPDTAKVKEYLAYFKLSDKVVFENNTFNIGSLSTGQKKRLALIQALLEDRPILILDEWAADQDPEFRRFFYTTVLSDIKRMGKTIIAITHDDRYLGVADRVLYFEYGQIIKEQAGIKYHSAAVQ
ncbi:MAG TPA: cyclic peptide export ABC transporter [Niastella sp.]